MSPGRPAPADASVPTSTVERLALPGGGEVAVHRVEVAADRTQPVVLVHGLGGSARNWDGVVPLLPAPYDPWVPDLPGYGDSPPVPTGDHGVDDLARGVVAVLEAAAAQSGGPVPLVGSSLGGVVALRAAVERPDLVRSLALLSPALPARRVPRDAWAMAVLAVPRLGERVMRARERRPVEVQTRGVLAATFGDPSLVPPERLAAAVEERRRRLEQPHGSAVFLASWRSLLRSSLTTRRATWRAVAGLGVPVLVLYSGRDRLVSAATADRWRRALPAASVVLLPTAGHVPHMERPALVARLLLEHWAA